MTVALLAVIFLLALALALYSFVQLLYLESLRLRPRDYPAMLFFKSDLESRLRWKAEPAVLRFSLIKHTLLVLTGLALLAFLQRTGQRSWGALLEAAFLAWLLMLVAAYLAPQVLYRRTQGRWLEPFVALLRASALFVQPLAAILEFFHSLVDLGGEANGHEEPASSVENIDALISAGAEEGIIEEGDRKLIQSVVEFGDRTAREVMTARPDIVAIPADASLEDLRQLVINERYSRIPVYDGDIDHIAGFVHVRDMFELDEEERKQRTVRELMRPVNVVPETKHVSELTREMQQAGAHMVIVVDEYGNTAGLCTLEDLVEVILGEIRDEHEPGSDVVADGDGFVVSGSFDVSRLNDILGFRPQSETESTTVGGLVSEWLGRVPNAGDSVERDGIRIEILASNELRVERVRISRPKAAA